MKVLLVFSLIPDSCEYWELDIDTGSALLGLLNTCNGHVGNVDEPIKEETFLQDALCSNPENYSDLTHPFKGLIAKVGKKHEGKPPAIPFERVFVYSFYL